MATYTYSVVGAGSTSDNPVTVYHDCGVDTVLVCWTGRLSTKGMCDEDMYFDDEYCDSVTVSPTETSSGAITWTDPNGTTHPIHYKSISRPCTPDPTGCTSGCVNSTLTAYASPMYISDSGKTYIYYDSVIKCYGRVSGVIETGVTFSGTDEYEDVKFTTPYNCSGVVRVYKAKEDECTPGCKADLSVSVNREYVPASGTVISGSEITFRYKKVTTDDECREITTNGMYIYDDTVIIDIPECTSGASGSGKEYQCCHNHYVDMDIPVSALSEHLDVCDIYYNGKKVESGGSISYRILQKAKTSGECSGVCEERTTYCVDSGSVKVCYEDGYLTNKWLCPGGCDCTSLSISGFNGNYAVPYTGGRIKVTWNYSAHTITPNCTEFDVTGGTWEEIITVGGCDERPNDCDTKYNKITYHDEQGRSVETTYDDKTYGGCEKCDAECCYNYDGNGKCRCVILFKEQTPGCTTCDSCTVWDDDEKRNITYNKIRYKFVQDCNATCDSHTVTVYSAQTSIIEKCDYPGGDITVEVPFTSTTEYTGIGCPPNETKTDKVTVKKHIDPIKNTSHMDRVIYEDDMLRIVQKSGETCVESASCDCNDLTINFDPPGPTPPEPTDCDVDNDDTLNGYIANVTKGKIDTVLTNIVSATNTKCTYKYLKAGYDFVKTKTSHQETISWMLANMLAELTPYVVTTQDTSFKWIPVEGDTATNYFVNAASTDGGGLNTDPLQSGFYENRCQGAIEYAKFKHTNYQLYYEMAEKAREELRGKGISQAKLREDGDLTFLMDETVHVGSLIPRKMPSNKKGEGVDTDWGITQGYIDSFPDTNSERITQALKDKHIDNEYYCYILGLQVSDKNINFVNQIRQIGDASSQQTKLRFARPRPGTQHRFNEQSGGDVFTGNTVPWYVYPCDCEKVKVADLPNIGPDCDAVQQGKHYCERDYDNNTDPTLPTPGIPKNSYMSYASGHSIKGIIILSSIIEAFGDSMNKDGYTSRAARIKDYCENRAILRAHWTTDVTVGKLIGSIQIGFLNGFKMFNDEIKKIMNL